MAEAEFQDLIIVKRRLNTDPDMPKGGVWKIAFADFMTAMMCFFLVMWLINAANEDTRQAVASYFNPVRLAELNRKGLQDPKVMPEAKSEGEQTLEESTAGPAPDKAAPISRDALFKDPYRVLSELSGEEQPGKEPAEAASPGGGSGQGTGPAPGGAFRDPFDQEFGSNPPTPSSRADPRPAPAKLAQSDPAETGSSASAPRVANKPVGEPSPRLSASYPVRPASPIPMLPASSGVSTATARATKDQQDESARDERGRSAMASEVSEAIGKESGAHHSPKFAVEKTGEGVTISLTDDAAFGMFGIGSAEPKPELIRIMGRIAEILKKRPGSIVIRGHTDARPFHNGAYDNWRLSTDRAQMAYYMLVRGGLDEKRIEAIEGYADRKLKLPADPEAAENRRIEILLREPAP